MDTRSREIASELPSPAALAARLPRSPRVEATVERGRRAIRAALRGADPRFVAIVGPCSIHEAGAALDYARRLAPLATELGDTLTLVMRTYFEKPRSALGWKGFINDPDLDGTCDMAEGLARARALLREVNELGVPCASEILDPIVRHYTQDLLAWACIGARTSESQIHREMASGLLLPVGIKNPTSGELGPAIDAVMTARSPHRHLGVAPGGGFVRIQTAGNPDAHLVLRGGARGPNFSPRDVADAAESLEPLALARPVLVDCSHGNSGKDPELQPDVLRAVVEQFETAETPLLGAMLESHLRSGRQPLRADTPPAYGVSLTDACLGWPETESLLREVAERLRVSKRRAAAGSMARA
jgi:3-deoxy-7-phosphoheptulonate synthase